MDVGELNDLAWRVGGLERIVRILAASDRPPADVLKERRRDLERLYRAPETAPDMRRMVSFELQLLRDVAG